MSRPHWAANVNVLYSAAHAEFPDTEPLGGGKAVADYLIREWKRSRGAEAAPTFQLTVLSPKSTATRPRRSAALHQLSEREYARFCREFERVATAEILRHDPRGCVVLSNDVSEGPDFRALGARRYRVVTIFHVDVVEYFTKFYLRGWVKPATAARWLDRRWLPDVLRLVFEKQRQCVQHSARIVVPSAPMKETIVRCYPWCEPEQIVVLPWGNIAAPVAPGRALPQIPKDEFVILTLSRLSPEKGIERLLRALPLVRGNCRVLICGAPAYMQGRRYEQKLRRMADGRAEFLGHVTGERKAALLQRADLFVSPSRHESYGLTIAEATAAGCPVISHPHYGATGLVIDCANRRALAAAIDSQIARGRTRKNATPVSCSRAATELAKLLLNLAA